jgi:hypothetical protein
MKFNYSFGLSLIALSMLISCGSPKDTALQSPAGNSPEATAQPKAGDAMKAKADGNPDQQNFVTLQNVIAQTKSVVKKGDFVAAKSEFARFEASWSKVEDGVKARSRDSYNRIEEGMDTVQSALKNSKSEQAISALDALDKSVQSVAKSVAKS